MRGSPGGPPAAGDLVTRLDRLAQTAPESVLFVELMDGVTESGRLTAAGLRDGAAAVAGALVARGVGRGDVALLIATPPLEFLIGLMGCLWAGVIAAPVAFPRRPEHLAGRLEPVRANADAVAVVAGTPHGDAEAAVLDLLTFGTLPVVPTRPVDGLPLAAPVAGRHIAYLQYTSGSTTDPRGVVITHDNLTANLEVGRELLGLGPDSVTVSWCPLTHDMGLILGALPAVAFGSTSVLMPPAAFIRRPLVWLRALDRYRGTHGYSPNFGFDLCVDRTSPQDRAALDLSGVRTLVNGAEPVLRDTRDRFVAAFGPSGLRPDAHAPGYGLAESSVLVSASPPGSPGRVLTVDAAALERHDVRLLDDDATGGRALCADGVPGRSYDVRIVDPVTLEQAGPGRVGELWLRGPSVSPGYWRREAETAATFGATLPGDDGGPYLRTGDLAFLADGQIVVCGRAKDVIVIRGRNLYPQDVELAAERAHPAVRRGGAATFAVEGARGEELVVVAEVDEPPVGAATGDAGSYGEVARAVTDAVLRGFEVHVADVLLVGPHQLPKTSSGKKQRSLARELWRARRADPLRDPVGAPA